MTNQGIWKHIQRVSVSLFFFWKVAWLIRGNWKYIQGVSLSLLPDKLHGWWGDLDLHPGGESVSCVSWEVGWLMRGSEKHPVCKSISFFLRKLHDYWRKHIQGVSFSVLYRKLHDWWGLLKIQPGCESVSVVFFLGSCMTDKGTCHDA